jgi:aryl-alcohol dehydrogenase-like predicted oxidoreductase
MTTRTLAPGVVVSSLGLGCMGMSYAYGPGDEAENLKVLHRYVELGGSFLDTAEIYGPHSNELLLGKFLKQTRRDALVVATKFGFRIENEKITGVDSSAANIRKACEGSLKRLQLDTIDLYYQHRVDPNVPIEDVVSTMVQLKEEGKIRMLGLSECSAATLERAHRVHPIAALQSEWSLWSRDIETNGVLAMCRKLGVTLVPYSPLGRGFLSGAIQKREDLTASDWRLTNPRFSEGAFEKNLSLVKQMELLATKKKVTPSQLALAWVLQSEPTCVPIPGTKRLHYLEQNMAADAVTLSADELATLSALFPVGAAAGERYSEMGMKMVTL